MRKFFKIIMFLLIINNIAFASSPSLSIQQLFLEAKSYAQNCEYEKAGSVLDYISYNFSDDSILWEVNLLKLKILREAGRTKEVFEFARTIIDKDIEKDKIVQVALLLNKDDLYIFDEAKKMMAISFFERAYEKSANLVIKKIFLNLKSRQTSLKLPVKEKIVKKDLPELKPKIPLHHEKNIFEKSYKVACILPLSGQYQKYGEKVKNGILTALYYFSSKNPDIQIKLVFKDSKSDEDMSLSLVDEAVSEKSSLIIGPVLNSVNCAKRAQEKKIPIITFSQKEDITDIGKFVFRHFLTPKMQIEALLDFIFENSQLRVFVILYPDDDYGRLCANIFYNRVWEKGGEVFLSEKYDAKKTDFSKKIENLISPIPIEEKEDEVINVITINEEEDFERKDDILSLEYQFLGAFGNITKEEEKTETKEIRIADFDAVFIPDSPNKSALIFPQFTYNDVNNIYFLGTNLWHSELLYELAYNESQFALFSDVFYENSNKKSVQDFLEIFTNLFGTKAELMEAISYDTGLIAFEGLKQSRLEDSESLEKVADALLRIKNFEGATGRSMVMENGDFKKEIRILKIQGQKFVKSNPDFFNKH